MGHSQLEKAKSHDRILKQAAEQIRDAGLDSISVGKLMRSVDLTHGGFYAHFMSRAQLLEEALEQALQDGAASSELASGRHKQGGYSAAVRSYLSRQHRDSRSSGCAIAALASDVARSDPEMREVMTTHVERFAQKLSQAGQLESEDQALFAISAMIGALLLSRVITDPQRSDAVLAATKQELLALGNRAEQKR